MARPHVTVKLWLRWRIGESRLVSSSCVYDSVLADAKFPVAFQGAPERDAHSMRIRRKALLDRSGDASRRFEVWPGDRLNDGGW